MPDLIDIVLDKLSVSSLELLDGINLNLNRESEHYSEELEKSVDTMERVYFNRCSVEVNNKTELLIWKTRKHKNLFEKYNGQFKKLQIVGISSGNSKKIKAYNEGLNHLEKRLNNLRKESGDLEPEDLFIKIHDMHKKIEDYEKKIGEIKERLKCYENFPASITGGQYCLTELKTRIKEKEAILESNLY